MPGATFPIRPAPESWIKAIRNCIKIAKMQQWQARYPRVILSQVLRPLDEQSASHGARLAHQYLSS